MGSTKRYPALWYRKESYGLQLSWNGNNWENDHTGSALSLYDEHTIKVTKSDTNVKLYVNGSKQLSITIDASEFYSGSAVMIQHVQVEPGFQGTYKDVYYRPLSSLSLIHI